MRAAPPRLAPLAGLTLSAHLTSACALPAASVADTVAVPAALAQPVSVASGAAAVRAASGTPGQRHLFHAGSWGLLHIHDVQDRIRDVRRSHVGRVCHDGSDARRPRRLGERGNLTHATLDTATPSTWNTAPAGIPAFPGQTVQELFLACGASHVFAFVVLDAASAGAAGQDVLVSVLDVTSGIWSPFSTVVGAQSGVVPCYLSGFDRVVSDGGQQEIGLVWAGGAASDTGCVGTSSALYTAIVPLPSSPGAY